MHFKNLQKLYKQKTVLNRSEYCERLIDYVVAYACKGEVSSTDAVQMFAQIAQSALCVTTSVATLAQRLNMKLMKSREIPKSEAVFLLQRLNLYMSSKKVKSVSLKVGDRTIEVGADADGDEGQIGDNEVGSVKQNQFDLYFEAKTNGEIGSSVTFSQFVGQNGFVPNFTHAEIRATWPLTEGFSRTMLILHKPVSNFAQIKGAFFRLFLISVYCFLLYRLLFSLRRACHVRRSPFCISSS